MRERLRLVVRGAVQGVGFRPFVYKLAGLLGLDGWVRNTMHGVLIEVEGPRGRLESFREVVETDRPPRAFIQSLEASWLDDTGMHGFDILFSNAEGEATALVLPDIAMCDDCRSEIFDPADRRHRYPFTNCTNCGPRFSIIESLPYDRAHTSMRGFTMCPACRREYDDPEDRRFHAQPNACPVCGPQLSLWDEEGAELLTGDDALRAAVDAIRLGRIVAVKGIGGFHLIVDATRETAVARLRHRKHREEKPLAVMFPDLSQIEQQCMVRPGEARLLTSPESPIVLLDRRRGAVGLSASIAPGNPTIGAMLPYTPLHTLLLTDLGTPVVATSGNQSDEPICIDEHEALERLRGIADLFLVHDRPIVRHVDDSIARVMLDRELVMRRARGYAPLPIPIADNGAPVLAVGAHLKNTVALAGGRNVFVSQHIGDLETAEASTAFTRVIDDLQHLLSVKPEAVIADLHPDYRSTHHAARLDLPLVQVQHHVAHVAACMVENDLKGEALGVCWDGTGYGTDGTVWGGEFLLADGTSYDRVGSLRPFRLPGGDRAVREPRRSALGALYEIAGDGLVALPTPSVQAFEDHERALLIDAIAAAINAPVTTSAGRLFDAVASLAGLRQVSTFEGQAAMALEHAVTPDIGESYRFGMVDGSTFALGSWQPPPFVIDWGPMLLEIIRDVRTGVSAGVIAARTHNTLADAIVAAAIRVDVPAVVLTGGCFQNRYLTEHAVDRLRRAGFRPYWHQRIPPNDGGISLGQVAVYRRAQEGLACASPYPDASSASTRVTPSFAVAASISRA